MTSLCYRLCLGSYLGLAMFAALSHALLLMGLPFLDWSLPVLLGMGWLVTAKFKVAQAPGAAAPRWLALTGMALFGLVLGILVYGSLVTFSRHWDGAVAWEMKAYHLTLLPNLTQDYFASGDVFCHSRDYPLLQPLCIAAGNRLLADGMGRLFFPCLYLLGVATVGLGLRQKGVAGWIAWCGALAFGLTTMLINNNAGGADSGYGELALCTMVIAMATGLLLGNPLLLACAIFLAMLQKPEGMIYGSLALAVLWCRDSRGMLGAGLWAWLLSAALWLPLQHGLQNPGSPAMHWLIWASLLGLGLLIWGSRLCLDHFRIGARARTWIAVVLTPLLLLSLPLLIVALGNSQGNESSMALYLGDSQRIWDRLPRLPAIAAGFWQYLIVRARFELTFVLLLCMLAHSLWQRRMTVDSKLAAFVLLGLLSLIAPFLLSPEEDLQHHLRSSLARLAIHWLGAVWLLIMLWFAGLANQRQ